MAMLDIFVMIMFVKVVAHSFLLPYGHLGYLDLNLIRLRFPLPFSMPFSFFSTPTTLDDRGALEA